VSGRATGGRLSEAERGHLERLLASHEPADDGERAHLATVRAFAARHPDPFSRQVAEGHLTGSAFVIDPAGRVLLGHHRRLDLWVQLGGHSDGEREAEAVALREAREESGLSDLTFHAGLLFPGGAPRLLDVDVHPIPARGDEAAHHHHDLRFLLVTGRPGDIRADPRETKALLWLDLDAASRRGDPGLRRALDKIARLPAP
jgi:8-oxo-dGTP pyrophosphatase MutT (NUDIX family)